VTKPGFSFFLVRFMLYCILLQMRVCFDVFQFFSTTPRDWLERASLNVSEMTYFVSSGT